MSADQTERLQSLTTWGTVSYVLHLIVAISALVPGGQFSPALLIVALVLDLVKRAEAVGTWHASHFRWRIRTVLIAAALYLLTLPLWFFFLLPCCPAGWPGWAFRSGFSTASCAAW